MQCTVDYAKIIKKVGGVVDITAAIINQQHEEDLQRLRGLRLIDDDFLTKCFDNSPECAELVLRIVLNKPDLKVLDVATQVFVANLLKRSVRMDVLATDGTGRKFNVEVQRADKGAGRKRARYNSSMLDAKFLEKGDDFEQLHETYVVFITEHDVMGHGLPVYSVERYITETKEKFDDGTHILYVNGQYRGENNIGKLMNDFFCTNPADMHFPVLAERAKYFKENEEGVAIMCKVMEQLREESIKQGLEQGKQEQAEATAKTMLAEGELPLDRIAKYSGVPIERVEELQAAMA